MSNLTHSFGAGKGGYGNETLLANRKLCTLETCDLSMASFMYLPSIPGNAIFAAIFGLLFVVQIFFGVKFKTWGYMVAMLCGLGLEVVGYIGRAMLHDEPFNDDWFLMYLVTLTIAPAFITASIYLCLARIVNVYGENLSFFKPRTYTIVFCTCDFICLMLQAAGGGLAASGETIDDVDMGKNIMIAGLVAQVVALSAFSACCAEFAFRVYKAQGRWNPKYLEITNSKIFQAFLIGLLTAVVTILARSVYRCVELSGGFESELFVDDEVLFMILEGAMIAIATICLTALHPGLCFQGAWGAADFKFRTKKSAHNKLESSASDEESQMQTLDHNGVRQ